MSRSKSRAPTIVTQKRIREKYDDGKTVRVEREVAHYSDNNFAADGNYREFHPNGKPFVEGQFRKGRQEGEWTYYFENGQVNRKATYNDGKPNGSWEIYRADGTLVGEARFQGRLARRRMDHVRRNRQAAARRGALRQRRSRTASGKPGSRTASSSSKSASSKAKRDGASTEWDDKGKKLVEIAIHRQQTEWHGHALVCRRQNDCAEIQRRAVRL